MNCETASDGPGESPRAHRRSRSKTCKKNFRLPYPTIQIFSKAPSLCQFSEVRSGEPAPGSSYFFYFFFSGGITTGGCEGALPVGATAPAPPAPGGITTGGCVDGGSTGEIDVAPLSSSAARCCIGSSSG